MDNRAPQNIGSSSFSYFLCFNTCAWEGFEIELVAVAFFFSWNEMSAVFHRYGLVRTVSLE